MMIEQPDLNSILELDLDPIKVKLMHVPSGEGWSLEKTNAVEHEYRRFLILMKLYPNEPTAPLEDVDTFWHYHILDTMKYAADCESVFGYFLHHFPYVGMRGEEDAADLVRIGNRMQELYEHTFKESYAAAAAAFCTRAPEQVTSAAFCTRAPAHTGGGAAAAFCTRAPEPALQAAFCTRAPEPTLQAAFCTRAPEPALKAAFCTRAPVRALKAAFCTRAPEAIELKAAFCTRAPEPALKAAFCTRAPAPELKAAFCTRAPEKSTAPAAAFCTRAPAQQAAFCTRAPQAAFCTRAPHEDASVQELARLTTGRPRLEQR